MFRKFIIAFWCWQTIILKLDLKMGWKKNGKK